MELIYKITNTINGKFYIGKTKNIENRWKIHLSFVGKKRHPLYDAILQYGKNNFIIEQVDSAKTSKINELEKEWILKTNAIVDGYNLTSGGDGGDTFTNRSEVSKNITRKKISEKSKIYNLKNIEIHRINTENLWKKNEYREKVMESINKRSEDESYRKKISESVRNILKSPDKRKIWSECKKGDKNGRSLGNVIVTDLKGNEYLYETAKDAAESMVVTAQLIRNHCINGTTFQRGIYKGWKFRYVNKGG